MVLTTKHKVLLWVPTVLFMYLALGDFEKTAAGGLMYRIHTPGLISAILLLIGSLFVMKGERFALFYVGILLWALSIALLLSLGSGTLVIIHLY